MLGASLAFATMGVCVKFGSALFSSGEMVFYRGVVGVLFMTLWAKVSGVSLKTNVPKLHLLRSGLGVFSLSAWFYSIAHLHIATAMTLNYMSSVWLAAFVVGGALWWNKKKAAAHHGLQAALVVTVLAGFAGVVLMLRPEFEHGQELAGIVGLLSGMVAAVAYLQVSSLARAGEPEVRIVFYFAVGTVLAGLLSIAVTGASPWPSWESKGMLWLVPIGILASIGQVCITKAYGSGATLLVANLQYMGIVYAALYGLFVFGDPLPPTAWLGMALIIACGITAAVLRSRTTSTPNATTHKEPAEEF
jgi:S-adenosylmethionine uptake transporter